jgi:hypothetical protein
MQRWDIDRRLHTGLRFPHWGFASTLIQLASNNE